VASLALPFSTLAHQRHDFRQNVIERNVYVLNFYATFVCKITHYKK